LPAAVAAAHFLLHMVVVVVVQVALLKFLPSQ
jgi:hypothetical protein